jgi:hypothetical protein
VSTSAAGVSNIATQTSQLRLDLPFLGLDHGSRHRMR